jgi:hypothetical protein
MRAQQAHALYFQDLLELSSEDKSAGNVWGSDASSQKTPSKPSKLNFETLKELPSKVDTLLRVAAQEFSETARRAGGGDLRSYALYNAAQALARRDQFSFVDQQETGGSPQKNWEDAKAILETINPDPLHKLGDNWQYWLLLKRLFRLPIDWVLSRIVRFREQLEGATGLAASIASAVAETEALKLQVELAFHFINLRKNESIISLSRLPETAAPETKSQFSSGDFKPILDLLARIKKANIPTTARNDLVADYWNKLAFVAWERALEEEYQFDEWLQRVELYLNFINRPTWTPWQMNKVRLLLAKAVTDKNPSECYEEAKKMLTRILGCPDERMIRRSRRPTRRLRRKKLSN